MTEDLEIKLVKRFPHMFRDYRGDMTHTCMAWGMECDDGWFAILWSLCNSVESYEKRYTEKQDRLPEERRDPYEPFVFMQVKEKYGTLRAYHFGGNNYTDMLVDMAEHMSGLTCESCGATRDVYCTRGWVKVACGSCLGKMELDGRDYYPVIDAPQETGP